MSVEAETPIIETPPERGGDVQVWRVMLVNGDRLTLQATDVQVHPETDVVRFVDARSGHEACFIRETLIGWVKD